MKTTNATVALVKTPCGTMWFTADKRYAVSVDRVYMGRKAGRPVTVTTYYARDMHNAQATVTEASTIAELKTRLAAHIAKSAA